MTLVKPPLGVKPFHIWLEDRIVDLNDAIDRYHCVGAEAPESWAKEQAILQAIYQNVRFG